MDTTLGTSQLTWDSERGFRLNIAVKSQDVRLSLTGIPVPADGTIELFAQPIELDKLDLLFKAEVEVEGMPGQLHEAQVTFSKTEIAVSCVIEEVESGDLQDFECKAAVFIPRGVPESGGPKPEPTDDAELDWEDDDTLEAMLGEPKIPNDLFIEEEDAGDDEGLPAGGKAKGLDALLAALLSMDKADSAEDEKETKSAAPVIKDPGNAEGLLKLLVEGGDLELEDGHALSELIGGAAPIVASMRPSSSKAEALSSWLFSQDAVAELYMDDESLATLLEQW